MKELYVCISLDVEEEGLFSGRYKSRDVSLKNIPLLRRLAPLYREFGLPLTLFCAYPVFCDPACQDTLAWMIENTAAEAGAHLHHWSTPPLDEGESEPCRTHLLDRSLLAARLENLLAAGRDFLKRPVTSFRMGRWDLKKSLLPLLADNGILVDSSVCPLRKFKNGPDHFLALPEPYWVELPGGGRILEAPITQIPLSRHLASLWYRGAANLGMNIDTFHFIGALSANPFWHSQPVMRLASRLHRARNGRVLSLFWHSSELMPGGSPHTTNQKAADRHLAGIFSFCEWLKKTFAITGVTATDLGRIPVAGEYRQRCFEEPEDW